MAIELGMIPYLRYQLYSNYTYIYIYTYIFLAILIVIPYLLYDVDNVMQSYSNHIIDMQGETHMHHNIPCTRLASLQRLI